MHSMCEWQAMRGEGNVSHRSSRVSAFWRCALAALSAMPGPSPTPRSLFSSAASEISALICGRYLRITKIAGSYAEKGVTSFQLECMSMTEAILMLMMTSSADTHEAGLGKFQTRQKSASCFQIASRLAARGHARSAYAYSLPVDRTCPKALATDNGHTDGHDEGPIYISAQCAAGSDILQLTSACCTTYAFYEMMSAA